MRIKKLIKEGKDFFTKKQPLKKILISLYVSISSIVFGAAIFMNYSSAPSLFPFDDPNAKYTVNRLEDLYYVSYRSGSGDGISGVVVGNSAVNLESLLHKSIKIDGEFVYADKQCILNYCKNIERVLVVNIKSAEAIESK